MGKIILIGFILLFIAIILIFIGSITTTKTKTEVAGGVTGILFGAKQTVGDLFFSDKQTEYTTARESLEYRKSEVEISPETDQEIRSQEHYTTIYANDNVYDISVITFGDKKYIFVEIHSINGGLSNEQMS